MKKKIIIGVPGVLSLNEELIKNLEYCGYEVLDVSVSLNYKYTRKYDRIKNFIRKVFFGDKSYKKTLRLKKNRTEFENKIRENAMFDYALIIRPDLYPIDFLHLIKEKSKKMIGYQWDGLNVFPEVYKYIPMFDRFFVFDKVDLKNNLLPVTNFYFDYDQDTGEIDKSNKSVYFVGSYHKNRIKLMKLIADVIIKAGFKSEINVFTCKEKIKNKYSQEGINFMKKYISFEENLQNVKKAEVLVDFLNNVHNGLSLRTFEALGYEKKLITNNPNVKEYDFYHENNIFVFDENNINEIQYFLLKPYVKIENSIKEKYGFSNWIKCVLDEGEYQKITLH